MNQPPTRWYYEHITPSLKLLSELTKILYVGDTKYQHVEVLETVPFGRQLVLDGRTQSSEADEFVYHESLVQPGLVALEDPRTVFIAGGGEGATLREVLSHTSVQQVTMVDLDGEVVDVCKRFLPRHHQGAFDDPRLRLYHEDAGKYLETHPERYDFIIIDIPDPLEAGPAYLLYTDEFYSLVRRRLNPGGLVVVQTGPCGPMYYQDVCTPVHHTMSSVFPNVAPYNAHVPCFGLLWSFILAGDSYDPFRLSPAEIDARLSARCLRDLRFYDGVAHQGLFSVPKYMRHGMARERRIITKDSPVFAP
ncbi:MAG: polyamine aminopropyltransferase [Chloroflexi bacterium]|nr:polyamine aminopropyltransferase [Chloroflexota bacterium]